MKLMPDTQNISFSGKMTKLKLCTFISSDIHDMHSGGAIKTKYAQCAPV